jgi:tetratricopeptide (TPR) repeat protein
MISVEPGALDVERFEALTRAGLENSRAGHWREAAGRLREALSLWRGEALADVDSDVLAAREIPHLTELRLRAVEARIDADLHLGRHDEVITELRRLAAAHPLREHLRALLMRALWQDGQQAAALEVYQALRAVLIAELGVEPGSELRELQQEILTGEPALAAGEPAAQTPQAGGPDTAGPRSWPVPGQDVPRQLPAGVRHFAGRAIELKALDALLEEAGDCGATMVISAIGGTAGVGKTALAVCWARRVADRFPDGQLFVNLRGYDPRLPMAAGDALAGFLRAIGVPDQDIPSEPDERAARYRSLLAERRMLILLDNAREVEQVRPLLPGSPSCAVVVTSRRSLAGLVAIDGAQRLDLDLLPLTDAAGLLRTLIGERAATDPHAAVTLAAQCARLPLALRVAAELALARPAIPLADLVAELSDQRRRLDLLDAGGDQHAAVRSVFFWSYRHLDAGTARAFRLAGLHPGPDFDTYAVAALTNSTIEQADLALRRLAGAYLIQPGAANRYSLHDLLRAYARELAEIHDSEDDRRAALTRLFDHYLQTAAAAMDTLVPALRRSCPHVPRPATPAPPLTDPATARAWLDAHRASLVAVTAHAADADWPGHATRLATTLYRYLDNGGHYSEAITIYTCARRAARRTSDRAAEAGVLVSLGVTGWRQGRYQQATGDYQQALALFRQLGDQAGQARVAGNLGILEFDQGRYEQAFRHHQQALALFRQAGDQFGEAHALSSMGEVDARLGRYEQAACHQEQALARFRQAGERTGEAHALGGLGELYARLGRYELAGGYQEQALALFRQLGDRPGEACALVNLGAVDLRRASCSRAIRHYQQALDLFRVTGNRWGEPQALNGLGDVLLAVGQPDRARVHYAAALDLAGQIGNKYEQARARHGLGDACHAMGDPSHGGDHWRAALMLYTELGAPEAEELREQVAARALPQPPSPG